jgi:hypothetical protein
LGEPVAVEKPEISGGKNLSNSTFSRRPEPQEFWFLGKHHPIFRFFEVEIRDSLIFFLISLSDYIYKR